MGFLKIDVDHVGFRILFRQVEQLEKPVHDPSAVCQPRERLRRAEQRAKDDGRDEYVKHFCRPLFLFFRVGDFNQRFQLAEIDALVACRSVEHNLLELPACAL